MEMRIISTFCLRPSQVAGIKKMSSLADDGFDVGFYFMGALLSAVVVSMPSLCGSELQARVHSEHTYVSLCMVIRTSV